MTIIFWIVSILGAAVGAFQLAETFSSAASAPQQAAGAAMAAACAVIPYCLARAIQALAAPEEAQLKVLNEKIETHTKLLASMANTLFPAEKKPE